MLKRGDTVRVHQFGTHGGVLQNLDVGIVQSFVGDKVTILWLRIGRSYETFIMVHSDNLYMTRSRNILEVVDARGR